MENGAAATPGRRRTRIILIGSLVFVAAVVAVGFLYVRPKAQKLHRQASDALLCSTAVDSLHLLPPHTGTGVPSYGFRTSRTTAGQVAGELSRANASAHPWDQEASDTLVVRCQSGSVTWVVDHNGHAARLPSS